VKVDGNRIEKVRLILAGSENGTAGAASGSKGTKSTNSAKDTGDSGKDASA
jgi:hypothetical protein